MIADILLPKKPYKGKRFSKFGLRKFAQNMTNVVWKKYGVDQESDDTEKTNCIKNINEFLSTLETDFATIQNRQKFFRTFINDPSLLNFLLTEKLPTLPQSYNDHSDLFRYDNVASGTVNYLQNLNELLSRKPEYSYLQKRLTGIWRNHSWLKEVKKVALDHPKYSKYVIKTNLVFSKSDYGNGNYHAKSSAYTISFLSENEHSATMLNSLKLNLYFRGNKMNLSDVNETRSLLSLAKLHSLLEKSVNQTRFQNLNNKETFTLHIVIEADCATGKVTATTKLGKNKALTFIPIYTGEMGSEYTEDITWSLLTPANLKSNSKVKSSLLKRLETLSLEPSFIGSREYLGYLKPNFAKLYSEITDFQMLATLGAYFRIQKSKFVFPEMLPQEKMVTKINAGNNPLFIKKDKCIPNDVELNPQKTGYVLTGANTGGKTGYTNMIALSQILAQAGLPIFAKNAQLSVKNEILCHYIENNDVKTNLSRYASEMRRLHKIVEQITPESLVLLDEPFSGTSSEAGTEKAYDVIRILAKVKCAFVINTHFHGVIDKVGSNGTSTVANYHFLLPENDNLDSFKLLPGGIKTSYGENIAKNEEVDYESMIALLQKRGVVPIE